MHLLSSAVGDGVTFAAARAGLAHAAVSWLPPVAVAVAAGTTAWYALRRRRRLLAVGAGLVVPVVLLALIVVGATS